jgi:hypothetical protein
MARRRARRSEADFEIVGVIARDDDTTLQTEPDQNLEENLMLNQGEYVEINGTSAFVVTASGPVQVVAYLRGSAAPGAGGVGDPAMVILPPTHSWRTTFPIHLPGELAEMRVVITAPIDADILVDATPISLDNFSPIGESGYMQGVVGFEVAGRHDISSDTPISAVTVGLSGAICYAVPSAHSLD